MQGDIQIYKQSVVEARYEKFIYYKTSKHFSSTSKQLKRGQRRSTHSGNLPSIHELAPQKTLRFGIHTKTYHNPQLVYPRRESAYKSIQFRRRLHGEINVIVGSLL